MRALLFEMLAQELVLEAADLLPSCKYLIALVVLAMVNACMAAQMPLPPVVREDL